MNPEILAESTSVAQRRSFLCIDEKTRKLLNLENRIISDFFYSHNNDVKQFEGIKKACDCQTSLVVKKMSNQEVDDYLALVEGRKSQEAAAFIVSRTGISELKACYSHVGSQ